MNREILFRGKRVDNGKEVVGLYFNVPEHHNPDLSGKSIIISINNGLYFEVVPETVGQFTGLIDKNNKKIFEGDIVKGRFLYGREVLSVVAFKDGAFGLEWNRGDIKEFDAFTQMCNIEYEVIGNIFDKPEIL